MSLGKLSHLFLPQFLPLNGHNANDNSTYFRIFVKHLKMKSILDTARPVVLAITFYPGVIQPTKWGVKLALGVGPGF